MWYSKIDDPTGEWELLYDGESHGVWIPMRKSPSWTIGQIVGHFLSEDRNEAVVISDTEFIRVCMMEEFGDGVFVYRTYKRFPDGVDPNA